MNLHSLIQMEDKGTRNRINQKIDKPLKSFNHLQSGLEFSHEWFYFGQTL